MMVDQEVDVEEAEAEVWQDVVEFEKQAEGGEKYKLQGAQEAEEMGEVEEVG